MEDDSENKDLTKYLAGKSPTKTGSTTVSKRKRRPGESRSRSPPKRKGKSGDSNLGSSMRSHDVRAKHKENHGGRRYIP